MAREMFEKREFTDLQDKLKGAKASSKEDVKAQFEKAQRTVVGKLQQQYGDSVNILKRAQFRDKSKIEPAEAQTLVENMNLFELASGLEELLVLDPPNTQEGGDIGYSRWRTALQERVRGACIDLQQSIEGCLDESSFVDANEYVETLQQYGECPGVKYIGDTADAKPVSHVEGTLIALKKYKVHDVMATLER
eukprot:COSAG06_NODE_21337_length_760_cov_1.192133_2_plen_192_part_01